MANRFSKLTEFDDEDITPRKKMELIPGQKYHGTFWINEYGEFQCKPAQEGTRPGGGSYRILWEDEYYSIYESAHLYKATFKIAKENLNLGKIKKVVLDIMVRMSNYLN